MSPRMSWITWLRDLEHDIGKITPAPHRSREILKQQQISQGILCHEEEGLQETSTNIIFLPGALGEVSVPPWTGQ